MTRKNFLITLLILLSAVGLLSVFISIGKFKDYDVFWTAPDTFLGTYKYRVTIGGVSLGDISLVIEKEPLQSTGKIHAFMDLKAISFLQKLSGDNIGVRFYSEMGEETFLPLLFEDNTRYKIKKGKRGKKMMFDHDQLTMSYKSYTEDISLDARDPLSVFIWLMRRDYEGDPLIKSTVYYHRDRYLLVGRVLSSNSQDDRWIRLKLKILQIHRNYEVSDKGLIEMLLLKKDTYYLPVVMKKGLFKIVLGNL